MLDRVRNQIVWNGRKSKMAQRLARVVVAISNRVEALQGRVEELESAIGESAKGAVGRSATVRRRKTKRRHHGSTVEVGRPSAIVLGNRLKADRQHCHELLRRTKDVLYSCLRGYWAGHAPRAMSNTNTTNTEIARPHGHSADHEVVEGVKAAENLVA